MERPPAHCFHCKHAQAKETGLICAHPDWSRDRRPEVPIKGRAEFCPAVPKNEVDAEIIRKFMAGKKIENIANRMMIFQAVIEQTLRVHIEALEKRVAEFEKGGYS